jgi:hypothetical protein
VPQHDDVRDPVAHTHGTPRGRDNVFSPRRDQDHGTGGRRGNVCSARGDQAHDHADAGGDDTGSEGYHACGDPHNGRPWPHAGTRCDGTAPGDHGHGPVPCLHAALSVIASANR